MKEELAQYKILKHHNSESLEAMIAEHRARGYSLRGMPFFGAGEFCQGVTSDDAPSNQLIAWVISHGFATGHAITEGDLLEELSEGIQDLYAVNDDLRAFKQQFITLHYVYKLLGVNK